MAASGVINYGTFNSYSSTYYMGYGDIMILILCWLVASLGVLALIFIIIMIFITDYLVAYYD